jgi:hypothetical protein
MALAGSASGAAAAPAWAGWNGSVGDDKFVVDLYRTCACVCDDAFLQEPVCSHYSGSDVSPKKFVPPEMEWTFSVMGPDLFKNLWTGWALEAKAEWRKQHMQMENLWKGLQASCSGTAGAATLASLRLTRTASITGQVNFGRAMIDAYLSDILDFHERFTVEVLRLHEQRGLNGSYESMAGFFKEECVLHRQLKFLPALTHSIIHGWTVVGASTAAVKPELGDEDQPRITPFTSGEAAPVGGSAGALVGAAFIASAYVAAAARGAGMRPTAAKSPPAPKPTAHHHPY